MKKHPTFGDFSVGDVSVRASRARLVSSRVSRLLFSNNPSDRYDAEALLDAARRDLVRCAVCRAAFGEGEKPQGTVAVLIKKRVLHSAVCGKCVSGEPEEVWRSRAGKAMLKEVARAKEGPAVVDAWHPASDFGNIFAQSVDKVFLVSAVEPGFRRFIIAARVGDYSLTFARIAAANAGEVDALRRDAMAVLTEMGAHVRELTETAEAFEDAARVVFKSPRPEG
jgi:hypothetical protein